MYDNIVGSTISALTICSVTGLVYFGYNSYRKFIRAYYSYKSLQNDRDKSYELASKKAEFLISLIRPYIRDIYPEKDFDELQELFSDIKYEIIWAPDLNNSNIEKLIVKIFNKLESH